MVFFSSLIGHNSRLEEEADGRGKRVGYRSLRTTELGKKSFVRIDVFPRWYIGIPLKVLYMRS